ncbi:PARP-type zinc finger-containing protein [Sphaceloma murrayae]|uniref:PARP-type zinc finger-containing protein n=1 Tax=Sphaceloma murrayae TaxID=2082308 RepID=A0A2K1QFY0_9PEZI|nr:PARP-type zinc finger-containing protein [Sphaceloma murrayae]
MPYRFELASTGRAGCQNKACKDAGDKIQKGELRQGTWTSIPRPDGGTNDSWKWRHWGCVTPKQLQNMKNESDADVAVLDGLDELPADVQAKIFDAIARGYVDDADCKGPISKNRPAGYKWDSDDENAPKKTTPKKRGRKANDEDDDEDDDVPAPKRGRKSAKAKKEETDDDVATSPAAKPAPKGKRKSARDVAAAAASEGNGDEAKAEQKPKKGRGKAKDTKEATEEDDAVEKKVRPSKKKAVKAVVKDELDDEEGDGAPEEEAPKARGRGGRPRKKA